MDRVARRILITGAGGFVGRQLVARLLAHPDFTASSITLSDLRVSLDAPDERLVVVEGDFGDDDVRSRLLEGSPDTVVHLAGILGGAAEADPGLSRRVNVDATVKLLEDLRDQPGVPRVVFASSIAVFGPPLPEAIDDSTRPHPVMTYGAQKLVIETLVEQFSARGWIDGLAIRLPGIVARRDADARQRAAFLNLVFYACEAAVPITLPVSADGHTWMLSVPGVVDDFIHAMVLPGDVLGQVRAFTLPAQRVNIGELVEALGDAFPASRGLVAYDPDPELTALFTTQPPLTTALADELGFRHDGDVSSLVKRAIMPESE